MLEEFVAQPLCKHVHLKSQLNMFILNPLSMMLENTVS